jgi:acetyl-CoA decarbonylase/synthase complex subunit gamma
MAFAMQVAAKQRALTDCPHISDEGKEALSDASAPPIRLVKIGPEGKSFEIGQETVMFRHEEKFHRPTGIAIRIPASLSDEDAAALVERANKSVFPRVGATLKVALCAVEVETADPAARAKLAAEKSEIPLILVGSKADALKAAVEAIKDQKPLIYKADASNVDGLA